MNFPASKVKIVSDRQDYLGSLGQKSRVSKEVSEENAMHP